MKRIFIALPIPDKISANLLPLQTGLEEARFSPPQNFHITLRFIGDMQENDIADLDEELSKIEFPQFEISFSGIGFFGNDNPHSIHVLVDQSPQLKSLHDKIYKICNKLGFAKDHKKYIPHVTLAYMKSNAQLAKVLEYQSNHALFKSKTWKADRFFLYSSTIGKGPSFYNIEAEFPLKSIE